MLSSTAGGSDRTLLFSLFLTSPIYALQDIYTLFVGFQSSTAQMFDPIMAYDARRLGTRFEIPVFLFQGESDVITLTSLAEEYFAEVEAPTKGLALIKDAGHFAGCASWHPCPSPDPCDEDVVLTPEDECLRLAAVQQHLPLRRYCRTCRVAVLVR